jgi:hypothetical protein
LATEQVIKNYLRTAFDKLGVWSRLELALYVASHGGADWAAQRIKGYEAAVRANRLLATALRAQGLNEESDNFAFRARVMQRGLRFQRRQFGRWLVSWGLAPLLGYGCGSSTQRCLQGVLSGALGESSSRLSNRS